MADRIGVLAPLSPPGWVAAGRHLVAGMELAAEGRPIELVVRDTAGDPGRAVAAVDELARLGVAALAGEFHSTVARAAAARAEALGIPFLCSSAVLDALTDEPADLVARLAPVQSRGWRVYAEFLLAAGHTRVAVATEPSVYWESGIRILRRHLPAVVEHLDDRATALLLLVGDPEPIVRAARPDVLIGAPAGQSELAAWGGGIPFLRYRPDRLGPLGARVEAALHERLGEPPSFVALEGYDTILALAELLDRAGEWSRVDVEGTRGRIRFTRTPESSVWQWAWAPIRVFARD